MTTPRLPHLLWGPPKVSPRQPRVLLGCSGSVATIKVPALVEQLERRGAHVIVVPTRSALHFLRAAAEAGTPKPHVTAATTDVEDAEVDRASSDLSSALANAKAANRNVTKNNERRGETSVGEFYDPDFTFQCQSALRCSSSRCSGLEKGTEVDSRTRESEDKELVQEKYCVTENSCTSEKAVQSDLVHCCTKASDCRPISGTDLRDKCSCDCVLRSSKCEREFSTNNVQTRTEIAEVKCYPIRDSRDVLMNRSSNESEPKTNISSISNTAHDARAPSHCLSCLKMLEGSASSGLKTHSGTISFPGASSENKPPALASPQLSPRNLTRPDSSAGGDSWSQLDRPPTNCDWCATQRLLPGLVIAGDALEWEGWRSRGDPVLHIELRRWADLGVIAPLSANTLAKMANGLCDNLLTCVVRAFDSNKPLLFCPAMNTHMYEHPLTARQIAVLGELGYVEVPAVSKRLMCGDVGGGAMAEVETVVDAVWNALVLFRSPSCHYEL